MWSTRKNIVPRTVWPASAFTVPNNILQLDILWKEINGRMIRRASHVGNWSSRKWCFLSMCYSGLHWVAVWKSAWEESKPHTYGLKVPFSQTPLLCEMKLLFAKAQDWDQVVQSSPHFSSLETNTLEVRINLKPISLLPVLAWWGLFMRLTLIIRLWMSKLESHSPYVDRDGLL